MKKRLFILSALFCIALYGFSQKVEQYTPYDEIPWMNKNIKPTYSEDMPSWAKKLYQYPANLFEITREYTIWEHQEKLRTGLPKIKTPMTRYFKIWSKNLAQYADANGLVVIPALNLIDKNLIKSQSPKAVMQRAKAVDNNSDWKFWGPKETFWMNEKGDAKAPGQAPWQVNVYSFDVAASNNDILFAGTETGFMNKTVDGGKHWLQTGRDYFFGGSVTAVAIDPTNPDIVYVGAGGTIHKTTDGGNSWKRTSCPVRPDRLKIDPKQPRIIYAATHSGLYRTIDSGEKWKKIVPGQFWDVDIKPDNDSIVYGITKNSKDIHMFTEVNFTDKGTKLKAVKFPIDLKVKPGSLIAVTPKNPNIVYAVLLANNDDEAKITEAPYLFKGTRNDKGEWKWIRTHKGTNEHFTGPTLTNGQGYFDLVLAVSPTNENLLFVGTTSLFKSYNGGRSLNPIGGYQGRFAIHPDIQDIKMLPNGTMWVATDGGMNFSNDNFLNNHTPYVNGLIGSDMWGFDQGWNEDICVGGRYHNGNTAIADFYGDKALRLGGAESATGWIIKGKSRQAVFNDLGSGLTLPATAEGKPGPRFLFTKHPNMDGYGGERGNVATHPYYSGTLYSGSGDAMWKSEDFGAHFDLIYDFGGRVRYFNISNSNPDVMYADVISKGFMRTEDGGKSWKRMNSPINWNGATTFAISPYNANVVYAAHQNGVNLPLVSDVFRTADGGKTWTKWSNKYLGVKSIVVQPTKEGKDLVYAFTTIGSGKSGNVYMRKDGDVDWTEYSHNYPVSMGVNIALPFFRDSKLRVAGTGGVWESPLAEPDFTPIIVPWVDKKVYSCVLDTVQFDDHSMLNHKGAKWSWSFTPEAKYISNKEIRNPKVVFENPGIYDVTLTVTKDGKTYSKTVERMVEMKNCPTIDDCNNPAPLPKQIMRLLGTDSAMPGNEAYKAFDGDPNTIWHTIWGAGATKHPHYIAIDLGAEYKISKMSYLTRQDESTNGNIKSYELYISKDKNNWGEPVIKGELGSSESVTFPESAGRYAKLVALSEVGGKEWASAAEITFIGCTNGNTGIFNTLSNKDLVAFPIPTTDIINVKLPYSTGISTFSYSVVSANGQLLLSGQSLPQDEQISIDVKDYPSGYYFVIMKSSNGVVYRVKFVKN